MKSVVIVFAILATLLLTYGLSMLMTRKGRKKSVSVDD